MLGKVRYGSKADTGHEPQPRHRQAPEQPWFLGDDLSWVPAFAGTSGELGKLRRVEAVRRWALTRSMQAVTLARLATRSRGETLVVGGVRYEGHSGSADDDD